MAEGRTVPTDGTRARLEAAVAVLNELGGLAQLEERDGALVIQGYSCPLAALTPDHPEVCRMAETLVTEVAGVPVYERCDRGERPRCCFEVATSNYSPEHKYCRSIALSRRASPEAPSLAE